jgi:hypothetical protein
LDPKVEAVCYLQHRTSTSRRVEYYRIGNGDSDSCQQQRPKEPRKMVDIAGQIRFSEEASSHPESGFEILGREQSQTPPPSSTQPRCTSRSSSVHLLGAASNWYRELSIVSGILGRVDVSESAQLEIREASRAVELVRDSMRDVIAVAAEEDEVVSVAAQINGNSDLNASVAYDALDELGADFLP